MEGDIRIELAFGYTFSRLFISQLARATFHLAPPMKMQSRFSSPSTRNSSREPVETHALKVVEFKHKVMSNERHKVFLFARSFAYTVLLPTCTSNVELNFVQLILCYREKTKKEKKKKYGDRYMRLFVSAPTTMKRTWFRAFLYIFMPSYFILHSLHSHNTYHINLNYCNLITILCT